MAAAYAEGADAVRAVEIAIAQENAVRQIGIDIKSAEGQAVAQSIRLSAESQTKIDAETAAIGSVATPRCSKMLAGPVGQLSTEDIRREPGPSKPPIATAGRGDRGLVAASRPRPRASTSRTVDDFGVAAGQGIGELTTSVVLYGESFEDVGKRDPRAR